MQFIVESTKELWAKKAADIVEETIKSSEKPVLVLPTGGTPVPMYEELVRRFQAGELSFKNMVSYNLDEYVGMDYDHPESYHGFMKRNLFAHVDALPENVDVPEGLAPDPEQAAADYNAGLDSCGGIDLAVLGIGPNGHIGFNEPGADPEGRTHVENLTQATIDANARFFDGDMSKVPTKALTMGIKDILSAKKILLLASGAGKAGIVKKSFQG
ncbi:MAG: glucosamine-6-phosphate deaminase, partial [Christensenellaceae bacterium]